MVRDGLKEHDLPAARVEGDLLAMRYDHGRENLEQNAVNFLGYDEE